MIKMDALYEGKMVLNENCPKKTDRTGLGPEVPAKIQFGG
jgi:hypothetical protein